MDPQPGALLPLQRRRLLSHRPGDGIGEHRQHRVVQRRELRVGQLVRGRERGELGHVQDLVAVGVPDPRDHLLIGDDLYPALRIFNEQGDKISQGAICLGICAGLGVDYEYCLEDLTVDQQLNINSSDCAKLLLENDEDYSLIDTVYNWKVGKGHVTAEGDIVIEEGQLESGDDCGL